jgi:transposase
MFQVETYAAVRRFVLMDGGTRREASRVFGISRETVDKMCAHSIPPGYVRTKAPAQPRLGPFIGIIEAILEADKSVHRKQRHTAKRIFERLRDEHGFGGGYTTVKTYVAGAKMSRQEMFVPLSHPPGHAQADFGEAVAVIGGVEQKIHFFCMSLPHSDACFVKCYPSETTEAFLDGHVSAFAFFGAVPISILYDNTKIAVAKVLGGGARVRTRTFTMLQSHFLFEDRFGRPGKGNDKGKVEALVKYARANFLTPIPSAPDFATLNAKLEERCRARQLETSGRNSETIGEKLKADLAAFRDPPVGAFEACDTRIARVSSISLVRYRGNDYSVPTAFGHRGVVVKGFVDAVVICHGTDIIARHTRSYEDADLVFDPLHYLALLETKPGALDQAAPLQGWALPAPFAELRRLLEARMPKGGKREYIQTLRLLENFALDVVAQAIEQAIALRAISYDAVKLLVLAKIERRPAALNLAHYPHIPAMAVKMTKAADYAVLAPQVRRAA